MTAEQHACDNYKPCDVADASECYNGRSGSPCRCSCHHNQRAGGEPGEQSDPQHTAGRKSARQIDAGSLSSKQLACPHYVLRSSSVEAKDCPWCEIERLRVFKEIFTRHKGAYSSGCACNIVESDDGRESFRENGQRIDKWCGLHQWYMDRRPAPETLPSSKRQLIATAIRPMDHSHTVHELTFTRTVSTEEMNAIHRWLNEYLINGPAVETNDHIDAERYRFLREKRSVMLSTHFHGNGCRHRSSSEIDADVDIARDAVKANEPMPFTHWSKDPLVPYGNCQCRSCVDARAQVKTDAPRPALGYCPICLGTVTLPHTHQFSGPAPDVDASRNPCRLCGKEPGLTHTPGFGMQLECCGIGIPFPPAPIYSTALTAWNASNPSHMTTSPTSSAPSVAGGQVAAPSFEGAEPAAVGAGVPRRACRCGGTSNPNQPCVCGGVP